MDFRAALKIVYEEQKIADTPASPFLIYSKMADLVGDSYSDKKKLTTFFAVEKRVDIFGLCFEPENENEVRESYFKVSDLLSESAFNRLIDLLIDISMPEIEEQEDEQESEKEEQTDERGSKEEQEVECEYGEADPDDDFEADDEACYQSPPVVAVAPVVPVAPVKTRSRRSATVPRTFAKKDVDDMVEEIEEKEKMEEEKRKKDVENEKLWEYPFFGLRVTWGKVLVFLVNLGFTIGCGVFHAPWYVYRWVLAVAVLPLYYQVTTIFSNFVCKYAFDSFLLCASAIANLALLFVYKDVYGLICLPASAAIVVRGINYAYRAFYVRDLDDGARKNKFFGVVAIVFCFFAVGTAAADVLLFSPFGLV